VRRGKNVVARLVADLGPTFEGWVDPLAFGIGWDNAIYAAARRTSEELSITRDDGIFPKSHLEHTTDYLVARWHDEDVQTVLVSTEELVVSFVQPTREGFLLAGARCHWCDDGPEQNALAVDWTGQELTRFTLGDGVQDLRVTSNGARALAAREDLVLMFGDYNSTSVGRRVQLRADGTTKLDGEVEIVDEEGELLPAARACGVGDKLHFFVDRRVLVVDDW
jgi:hypothetical protein